MELQIDKEKATISAFFDQGILLNKELLTSSPGSRSLFQEKSLQEKIQSEGDLLVLNEDYVEVINQETHLVDWYETDHYRVLAEKDRDEELYQHHLLTLQKSKLHFPPNSLQQTQEEESGEIELLPGNRLSQISGGLTASSPWSETASIAGDFVQNSSLSSSNLGGPAVEELLTSPSSVHILISYQNIPRKYQVQDFTSLFLSRHRFLEQILRQRQELQYLLPVTRIIQKKERDKVSLIGLVQELGITKKGNLLVKIEDPTGSISVVFSQGKKKVFSQAKELVLDEVIGITGISQGSVIFAEQILWPDLPLQRELKKSEVEEYAIFLSDLHVGSRLFLKEAFQKFLQWLQGKTGNEHQRLIAQQVKYIIISGDLVDGVGIYPSQEEELAITDISQQYQELASLFRQIPLDKKIIACPGNHDVVHLAEPQPAPYKEYAAELFTLPHLTLVSNPGMITIGKTSTFPGFDVLLYHGYSFDYYIANVESLRLGGGYKRVDLLLKYLLKRRHLAPSFKSTPYYPGYLEDPLLIKHIPDFFATGHIHYCSVAQYRGVTLISGSCWQDKTSFQEKLGHEPEPARVPLVNLKTREVKILRFL